MKKGDRVSWQGLLGVITSELLGPECAGDYMCPEVAYQVTLDSGAIYQIPLESLKLINMEKIELQFMVVPELLSSLAFVPDPIRVKIIDPEAIFLTGLLGESGKRLVKAGIEFYFTRVLAQKLIIKGIAEEVK